jgi:MFS family permease
MIGDIVGSAAEIDTQPVTLPPGGPWSRHYRRTTAGLLLTIASGAFEALAVATVMPATVDDLGGLGFYGWAFSAYMLTNLIGLVVAGDEADRRGPAVPFLAGVLCFTIGLLVGGFAPSMIVLILARAIQGFGSGLVNSVAYVTLGRGYPDEARPRMLALLSTAWVVPGLIGPAVAGLIATHIGWRWVFLGLAPMPFLAALLAMPTIRRIPAGALTARNWRRLRAALQLAAAMAVLLAGLGQSRLVLAGPLTIIGIAVSWTALRAVLPPGTLRARPGLPASIATMGLLNLAFFGVDAFVPLGLTDVRHTSTAFAGLALTAGTITWTAGSWLQAHYARQWSPRTLIRSGLAIIAVGIAGIIGVLTTDVSVLVGPLVWAIAGFGIGLAYSGLSLSVLDSAPPGQEGSATSAMQLANAVGGALATGIGGVLIELFSDGNTATRAGLGWQFLLMIGVLAIAILAAGRLPAKRSSSGNDEDDPALLDTWPGEAVLTGPNSAT